MSFSFAWPWLFAALPLPLLVAWRLPRATSGPGLTLRTPFYADFADGEPPRLAARARWRLVVAVLAWVALVSAAARPQQVGPEYEVPREGRNLMLAVDLSGSMQQEDMVLGRQRVNRLTAVKAVAGDFIERRVGDRIGLVLFGQQAYLQAPLTFDRRTVRTLLDEAAIGLAGKETAIGDAIGLAVKRLRDQAEGTRVLVLLTDGANTAGQLDPLKAAEIAAAEGIRIYTIGVGAGREARGFFGAPFMVGDEIDERTLRALAERTGGHYYRAHDLQALQEIYQRLDRHEPVQQEPSFQREVDELYRWPLALALALALLRVLVAAGGVRSAGLLHRRRPGET
ncbi:MAG: VWA domain-containing protein [Thiotrichales bacterium]